MNSLVLQVIESSRPAATAKGLEISTDLPDPKTLVRGDSSRLQQVLWNLVANAIKFTPSGGAIRISIGHNEAETRIEVSDTGQGIAPDFLPHLFSRFTQADSSTTRRHGGLGIGLSIAKQLVEMHGGRIEARSDGVGRGSCFVVTLPLAVSAERPAAEQSHSESHVLSNVSILVVDDEPDSRAVISAILTEQGANVTSVGSVEEAISACQSFSPEVLVSDIAMPEQDGFELIRTLREQGFFPSKLPAVAVSALARPEDRTRALNAGFQLHCAKPINPEELVAGIKGLLN